MTDQDKSTAKDTASKNAASKDAAPRNGSMRTGLRVVLIVSLALNLLVVGMVVGGMVSGRMPGGPLGGYEMSLGPFTQALAPRDRAAIRHDLQQRQDLHPPRPAERRQALAEFLAALRSDPFDPARIEAIFAAQREQSVAGMRAGQEVLLERLKAASPEDRAAYANRLEAQLRATFHGRGGRMSGS